MLLQPEVRATRFREVPPGGVYMVDIAGENRLAMKGELTGEDGDKFYWQVILARDLEPDQGGLMTHELLADPTVLLLRSQPTVELSFAAADIRFGAPDRLDKGSPLVVEGDTVRLRAVSQFDRPLWRPVYVDLSTGAIAHRAGGERAVSTLRWSLRLPSGDILYEESPDDWA
jgi:hypothetical protein